MLFSILFSSFLLLLVVRFLETISRWTKSWTNERWKLSNLGVLRLFKTQEEDEWLGQILAAIEVSFLRICANEIQWQHVNAKQTEGTSAKVKSELFSCPGIHCCTFTNFNKLRWNVRSLRYDVGFSMHTSGLQSIASRWIGRHINPGNIRFRSTDQVSQPARSFARKHCEFFFASSRFEALIFGCGEDMSLPEQLELTRHLATQLGSSFALPRGAKCSESQTYCESRLPFNSLQIVPRFLYVFFVDARNVDRQIPCFAHEKQLEAHGLECRQGLCQPRLMSHNDCVEETVNECRWLGKKDKLPTKSDRKILKTLSSLPKTEFANALDFVSFCFEFINSPREWGCE